MKKYSIILILIILFIPVWVKAEEVTLEKCVDGDTAKFKSIDGTIKTYRFLAIDTPETKHPTKKEEAFGKEASEYTCNALTNATKIILEFDENADKEDRYNRGLAWVFVDDALLQEQLISLGYAKVAYLYDTYKYTALLQEKEKLAKEENLGIWNNQIQEETVQTEQISTQEEKKEKKSRGFFESLIDAIIEAITASINQMIDSILQKLEDML